MAETGSFKYCIDLSLPLKAMHGKVNCTKVAEVGTCALVGAFAVIPSNYNGNAIVQHLTL